MGEGRGCSLKIPFRGIFRGILENRIYFSWLFQSNSAEFRVPPSHHFIVPDGPLRVENT